MSTSITYHDGRWTVIVGDVDITNELVGLHLESDEHHPNGPPALVLRLIPRDLRVDVEDVEITEGEQ